LVAIGLRRRNIEVTTSLEAGLIGAPDSEQLAFAFRTGRVIITRDADYLRLDAQGTNHNGIVYARQSTCSAREILQRAILLHDSLTAEDMIGRMEYF
jgi:predicted nuclease of predicted toxin-antitoxin system